MPPDGRRRRNLSEDGNTWQAVVVARASAIEVKTGLAQGRWGRRERRLIGLWGAQAFAPEALLRKTMGYR